MRPLKWPEQKNIKELQPLNLDPGVQSSNLNIDKMHKVPTLPTITEAKIDSSTVNRSLTELKVEDKRRNRLNSESDVGRLRMRKASESGSRTDMAVPVMLRKDVFYSGSVHNLKEFQSQKSLTAYRNSVISLNKDKGSTGAIQSQQGIKAEMVDSADNGGCSAMLGTLFDVSLLKDFTFVFLAISNLFGKQHKAQEIFSIKTFYFRYGCTFRPILFHRRLRKAARNRESIVAYFHYWTYQHFRSYCLWLRCRLSIGEFTLPE